MTTNDKAYWPSGIEKVEQGPGRQAKHIDPETGKQTYPSWHLRSSVEFLHPEDLGEKPRKPTKEDRLLMHRIQQQIHIDELDASDGLPTDEMIGVIRRSQPNGAKLGTRKIRQLMYGLWHAGLLRRKGAIYNQSGRATYQSWYPSV